MIIKTYPFPVEVTTVSNFSCTYTEDDNIDNNAIIKKYKSGDKLFALAKIKTSKLNSGYGYIVYDNSIEESFIVDAKLIEL